MEVFLFPLKGRMGKENGNMGKYAAKKMNEVWWDLCGCLLFLGISGPAYHRFYDFEGNR